jgi:hypothetical protein
LVFFDVFASSKGAPQEAFGAAARQTFGDESAIGSQSVEICRHAVCRTSLRELLMKTRVVCILLCLVALSGRASASTINFLGEGKVGIVEIHSPNLGDLWAYAGELEWAAAGGGDPFFTYCVDVNNWTLNTQSVTVEPSSALNPGVPDGGGKAAWLVNAFAGWVHTSGTGQDAAALQVAIWTSLYDSGPVLNSGPFLLLSNDTGITTKAQYFLSALYSAPVGGYYTSSASWLDAPGGHGQDQMPIPTPEPASLVLLGTGLLTAARRLGRRSPSSMA